MVDTLHIYVRVSTSAQEDEGTSIETQINAGVERALKNGMEYEIWNEGGQSSSKDDLSNRPKLSEILRGIETGDIKHLYVWNTDRLSRNANTWGMIRFHLIKNDVVLHTPTGRQTLSDPQTNLLIGILSEISQYDNKLRTERFRLGKLIRVRQGNWMGGPPPFGYKLEDHKLVVNLEESKWLEFIFTEYCKGCSIDSIRTSLMSNGVLTRRNNSIWSHASIDKLFANKHYRGFYTYTDSKTGETIRSVCPSILKPELIQQVQELKKSRSYNSIEGKRSRTSNEKYVYLLSSILYCGHCKSRYGGNYKTSQTSYYSCNSKTAKYKTKYTDNFINCDARRNLRLEKVDRIVWDTIVNILSNSHTFKESVKLELLEKRSSRLSATDLKNKNKKLQVIKNDLKKLNDSILNIETLNLLGKYNNDDMKVIFNNLENHRLKLEAKQSETINNILEVKQQQTWIDWVKEFGIRIKDLSKSDLSIEQKKRFLEGVVTRIIVFNADSTSHQLNIEFRLPYVEDDLVYNTQRGSIERYKIKPGTKNLTIFEDLVKKNNRLKEMSIKNITKFTPLRWNR
jgi:DNA invertase Pin-like site-specific DNA recombinase